MTPPPTWGKKKKTATDSNLKHGRGLHVTDANFFTSASTQSAGARGAHGGTNVTNEPSKGGLGPHQHHQQNAVVKPLMAQTANLAAKVPAAEAERAKPAAQMQVTKTPHSRAVRRLPLAEGGSNEDAAGRHIDTQSRRPTKTTIVREQGAAAGNAHTVADGGDAVAAASERAVLRTMQNLRAALRAEYAAADQSLRKEQRRLLDEVEAIEVEMAPVKAQLALDIVRFAPHVVKILARRTLLASMRVSHGTSSPIPAVLWCWLHCPIQEVLRRAIDGYAAQSDVAFEQSGLATPHVATLGPKFDALAAALESLPRGVNGDVLL